MNPNYRNLALWAIIAAQIGILAGILAFWEIGAHAGWIDGFFWSQPSKVADTFVIFFTEGDAWTDIGFTFRSTIIGFLIGTTAGSLFGLSFWWSRNYAAIVQPYIICFESIPKLALAPLVVLVFGIGMASKIAMAVALTFVISTLTTYAGVKALDPDGELLICNHAATGDGGLFTLAPNPAKQDDRFPKKLSESGLFRSVKGHVMEPGMIPYSVNAQLWSDGHTRSAGSACPVPTTRWS